VGCCSFVSGEYQAQLFSAVHIGKDEFLSTLYLPAIKILKRFDCIQYKQIFTSFFRVNDHMFCHNVTYCAELNTVLSL
jgi:hypothetical protein